MSIEVRSLTKSFGAFTALENVDLRVAKGELLALLGPSGSGKTTLLRIIAGLDWPDSGDVSFDGENGLARAAARHAQERSRDSCAGEGAARSRATRLAGRPLSEPVVRRPAPAHCAC